ncbi:MAG: sugar ABC transporter permease [Armatimonadetes bacterium]|nr:sugar ABC transporter permease [Armatimonadota bacterium]
MGSRRKQALVAALCLLPSALVLGCFHLGPLLRAVGVSLHTGAIGHDAWVGLANYRELLHDPAFWASLVVTMWFVLGTVPATLFVGYLVAELLNRDIRGRAFYRMLFFTPYVVSPVAASAVWKWMFEVSTVVNARLVAWGLPVPEQNWLLQPRGLFALLGEACGRELPAWAGGPSVALCCVMLVSIWTMLGFAVVVLLAGMSQVPADVIEAARLDGATGWQLRRRIIVPLLSPTLFFLLIVFVIKAFQAFNTIYVMTPGGLSGRTGTVTFYIYESAFMMGGKGAGYGSAVALVLFGIIVSLTLVQFRVLGKRVHYGGRA